MQSPVQHYGFPHRAKARVPRLPAYLLYDFMASPRHGRAASKRAAEMQQAPLKSSVDSEQERTQTIRLFALAAICRAGAWSGIGFPQDPHDGKSSNKAGWKSEPNTIWAGWISYRRIYSVLKNESNSEGKTQFSEISAAPTKRHAGSFSPVCDCVCFGGSALQDQLFSFLPARSLDLTSSMATGNTETIMIA